MSRRFGPEVRLRHRREFVAIQGTGRRVATRLLTVLALPNTLGHDRLGIVASRKLGTAVVRNRAKRRLRELFRERPATAPPSTSKLGLDLVVIPKREAVTVPLEILRTAFDSALGRLKAGNRS